MENSNETFLLGLNPLWKGEKKNVRCDIFKIFQTLGHLSDTRLFFLVNTRLYLVSFFWLHKMFTFQSFFLPPSQKSSSRWNSSSKKCGQSQHGQNGSGNSTLRFTRVVTQRVDNSGHKPKCTYAQCLKITKKSHLTLRATFTFGVDKSSL